MSPARRLRWESRNAIAAGAAAGALGAGGILSAAFIVLKLFDVIGWPWLLVLAPVWVPGGLLGLATTFVGVAYLITGFEDFRGRQRQLRKIRPSEHGPAKKWPR